MSVNEFCNTWGDYEDYLRIRKSKNFVQPFFWNNLVYDYALVVEIMLFVFYPRMTNNIFGLVLTREELFDKILSIDKKIRFVGIYETPHVYRKMQQGVTSYLSEFETETSLNQALYRWKVRLKFQQKIGAPIFAFTKYEKVYRVTMQFEKESILCVSTEIDVNIMEIINKVMEIRKEAVNQRNVAS